MDPRASGYSSTYKKFGSGSASASAPSVYLPSSGDLASLPPQMTLEERRARIRERRANMTPEEKAHEQATASTFMERRRALRGGGRTAEQIKREGESLQHRRTLLSSFSNLASKSESKEKEEEEMSSEEKIFKRAFQGSKEEEGYEIGEWEERGGESSEMGANRMEQRPSRGEALTEGVSGGGRLQSQGVAYVPYQERYLPESKFEHAFAPAARHPPPTSFGGFNTSKALGQNKNLLELRDNPLAQYLYAKQIAKKASKRAFNAAVGPQPKLAGAIAANANQPPGAPGAGDGVPPPPGPNADAARGEGAGHPHGEGGAPGDGPGGAVGPNAGGAGGDERDPNQPAGGGGAEPPADVRDGGEEANSEGVAPPAPYGPGGQQAEKAAEPDPNRTEPITPATGAQQTPATANSLVRGEALVQGAMSLPPEKVLGNATERANMGKGAYSGYEFCGPYDYPARPSGRLDSTLTSLGAWRSKTGEHQSSLWGSTYTEKGEPAKKEKYYKWSTKGGGTWSKLPRSKALNIMNKTEARKQGGRWMEQPTQGQRLPDIMAGTLKRKIEDIQMGRAGNVEKNKRMKGAGGRQVQK